MATATDTDDSQQTATDKDDHVDPKVRRIVSKNDDGNVTCIEKRDKYHVVHFEDKLSLSVTRKLHNAGFIVGNIYQDSSHDSDSSEMYFGPKR